MKFLNKDEGITLIALVITIIVLLILAGVTISSLGGQTGILTNAAKAKLEMAIAEVEEIGRLRAIALYAENLGEVSEETIITAVKTELTNKGYEIRDINTSTETVKGLLIKDDTGNNINEIGLVQGANKKIKVALDTEGNVTSKSYVKIERNYYELIINEEKVEVVREAYKEPIGEANGYEIKITPPASGVEMKVLNVAIEEETVITPETEIVVQAGNATGTFAFNVKETKSTKTRNVNVVVTANPNYATGLTIGTEGNVEAKVEPGKTIKMVANVTPATSTDTVSWSIKSGSATIDNQGTVTVNSNATVGSTITVAATCVRADGTTSTVGEKTFVITVKEVAVIDHSEVIVPTITATGNFANNSYIKEVREGEIPIPAGFTYVKGDKQGGAVITDSVDSNGNSNGSEFVWVPVLDVTKMYGTLAGGTTKMGKIYNWTNLDNEGNPAKLNWDENDVTEEDGKTKKVMSITSNTDYREPDTVSSYDGNADYLNIIKGILKYEGSQNDYANISSFKATMQRDFNSMIESVGKYGGFYIARYEMSLTNKAEFIKGAPSTTDATTTADGKSYMWYGLYARAKEYSTSSTQGSMVWGCQYDAMLKWMQTNNVNVTSPTPVPRADRNQNRTTGTKEEDKILNIYDIIGNSYEWTLEACSTDTRAYRGGYCYYSGSPSFRDNSVDAYGYGGYYSTRSALYIR